MTDFRNSNGKYQLNDAQMALLRGDEPIIDIVGDVESPMFAYVRSAVMFLRSRNAPDVQVFITSPGGNVDVGLDVYDLLRLYPGKKTATVYDKAASMGAMILQACDVRRSAKHSHILIHHISRGFISLDVLRSKKKSAEWREDMEKSQKRLYDILSERTGKTVSQIRAACAKDEFMTAQEALEFGLIDEIV